jgi:hypothetical protein
VIHSSGVLTAPGLFAPGNTLVNYEIAAFVSRARNLADNGCMYTYYGTPPPNGCLQDTSDTFYPYIQRLGDLNVFQTPSTVIGSPGCTTCIFGKNNTLLRSQMAIWMVTGLGLVAESVLSMNNPGTTAGPLKACDFNFSEFQTQG